MSAVDPKQKHSEAPPSDRQRFIDKVAGNDQSVDRTITVLIFLNRGVRPRFWGCGAEKRKYKRVEGVDD